MEKEMLNVILDLCERHEILSKEALVKTPYARGYIDGAEVAYSVIASYIKTTLAETDV